MKECSPIIEVFFELVKAGLWEHDVWLESYGKAIDFENVYRIAEEQSVVGIVASSLEHVMDIKVPKETALIFAGQALQLEQRNTAMNRFIGGLVEKMRQADIYTLLVKGQGVAQCYERPLWRASGDVDFFLSKDNYEKAKTFLMGIAIQTEHEDAQQRHIAFSLDSWMVELHGTLRCGLSRRMDQELDDIIRDTLYGGNVRSWLNNETTIFMLNESNDVVYIFSHFLKHFYKGGLGLRQICDWCRILWKYKNSISTKVVEKRLNKMGLMSEWKAFATFAVVYLGIPVESMILYDDSRRWEIKAKRIYKFILKSGNFGHNRDMNYLSKYPYLVRKTISFGRRMGDLFNHAMIFPLDSIKFFPYIVYNGLKSATKGE